MLFNLLAPLADEWSPLNVFRYQTFRSGSAILFAFFMTLYIGPHIIRWLKLKPPEGQPIRDFDIPPDVVFAAIDPSTGKLAGPDTVGPIQEVFISGTEPKQSAGTGSGDIYSDDDAR